MHNPQNQSTPNRLCGLIVFVGSVLAGLAVATELFAYKLNFQEALGAHLYYIYAPWQIVAWFFAWGHKPQFQGLFALAQSAGVMMTASILLLYVIARIVNANRMRAYASIHGSARWAKEKDIRDAGLFGKEGVFVGAWVNPQGEKVYLRHNGPEHVLCYAPTRSGKGVGLVVPTLLTWTQSAIITDLKGELWAMTAGWRKNYAKNLVVRFEPAAERGCARWNPFDEIRIGTEFEVADAHNLAQIIVDPEGKGCNDHWSKTSKALLEGCILHLVYKRKLDGSEATFAALDAMLADTSKPIKETWKGMIATEHKDGKVHPAVARAAQDMLDRPEQEGGSVLSTAKSFISLYRDPIVAKNTSGSDFRIHDLMNFEQPVSLYIITQPPDKDRLKPLVRVFLNMVLRVQASKMVFVTDPKEKYTLAQKIQRILRGKSIKPTGGGVRAKGNYKHRQLLMIDEFPSLGKLDLLQESLAFIAGYGMKAYLIAQDSAQLTDRDKGYGPDETVSSNCHIQNAYPPNKPATAEHLSKLTGQTTVVKESIQTSGKLFGTFHGQVSKSMQEVQRPLLTPDECLRMQGPKKDEDGMIKEAGDMLISVAGYPIIYGKQPLYFQDEVLTTRSEVPPPDDTDVTVKVVEQKEISLRDKAQATCEAAH